MIDSQPDLAPLIRRVRGGYLKIQGTWMPYEVSLFFIALLSCIGLNSLFSFPLATGRSQIVKKVNNFLVASFPLHLLI